MCACRVEEMKTSVRRTSFDLEDYIYEMESRGNGNLSGNVNESDADVFSQLAQKEKDLILAAELGKALLDKNEELKSVNERLIEEYTQKLEQLEQEKHSLRRKLDTVQTEYESKVLELQSDVNLLRKEIGQQQTTMGQSEREKMQIIGELTDQNQRLTTQLKQAVKDEEQLTMQLKSMKEQFHQRKSNLYDHVSHLEMLREEINMITEKKADLERRMEQMMEERDQLTQILDESNDRLILLEKCNKDQEIQMRNQSRDLNELRQTNFQLQEKIDLLSRRSCTPPSLCQTSLLNEIEMSEDDSRSYNSSQYRSRNHSQLNTSGFHDMEDDEIECDDSEVLRVQNDAMMKFRQEIVDIYHQLQLMCEQLRHRRSSLSSSSSDDINVDQIQVGMLTDVLKQLRGLLHDLLRKEAKRVCVTCGDGNNEREILEKELAVSRENNELMQRTLIKKDDILKNKSEQIADLTGKLTIQQTEMNSLQEERDLLRRDLMDSHLSKDEIVCKAWEARDQAIKKKNSVEIELAKSRIEVMNTNSQLIEAIQQKLELSQQLEQWQVDMEALLEQQMKKKLQERDKLPEDSDSSNNSAKHKFFGLWR